jgi:hypothetical protein
VQPWRFSNFYPRLAVVPAQIPPATFTFQGPLWYWRGPAPYYFVRVPADSVEELTDVAAEVTYGWGMVPVEVTIGSYRWETSLWPKDGGYLVPIRAQVRLGLGLEVDEPVDVSFSIVPRPDRPIDPSTGSPRRDGVRDIGSD